MKDLDLRLIFDYSSNKIKFVNSKFHRYLYNTINWESRLLGIVGARGVGKSTLLVQHIKENFSNLSRVLYISLDNIWFQDNLLYDLAQYCSAHNITDLYIDEVHRYKNWREEIKMINDTIGDLNIVYTGSSMLQINESRTDLSRRQTLYHLYGMSFREYLELQEIGSFPVFSLSDILLNHQQIASEITENIKILPAFEKYLQSGYYPFYKDEETDYLTRLNECIQTVLDVDLPAIAEISYATVQKAKRLLNYISRTTPFCPDLSVLFKSVETGRDSGLLLLNALSRAEILNLLSTKQPNYKKLVIPEKIFLQNPNLMYALSETPDIGSIRESYFMNQLSVGHELVMPQQGDFTIDGIYRIEVGGRNKDYRQIADIPQSYLAIDGIERGYGNKIPLWLFGFLY